MQRLSVFIDESGDFGTNSDYYIFSLVLHEQSVCSIDAQNSKLRAGLSTLSMDPDHCFHVMPIIRREQAYKSMDFKIRKSLLSLFSNYVVSLPVSYYPVFLQKTPGCSSGWMSDQLTLLLRSFIETYYIDLFYYDEIIIYYDGGQEELSKIIRTAFPERFNEIYVRTIRPSDYRLAQVADYCCTIELVAHKAMKKAMSKSEHMFFGSEDLFFLNYYMPLRKKLFVGK